MFKQFGAPELLILALIILLLFGAKRLPDAARGIGRSLRIFKAETKGLSEDGTSADAPAAAAPAVPPATPAAPVEAAPSAPAETPAPAPTERSEG